ncbi:hypothetical protein BN171_3890002 [Clostridioides difficile E25]|nr:hypothetical protein BN171_3890002 [Clostridioides difficile E25]
MFKKKEKPVKEKKCVLSR